VIDDRNIAVEIPVGASGASPIIVTNAEGASTAFSYTVAAS